MHEIKLDSLTRGLPLTFPTTLTQYSTGITVTTSALADTGAGGYVFIDTSFAADLSRTLAVRPIQLPRPIIPSCYNSSAGSEIREYLLLDLELDGHRVYNLPLLILGLGTHDLIIGRNFFEYFYILVDSAERRLIWPPEFPKTLHFYRTFTLPRHSIREKAIDWTVQQNLLRRDQAIARDKKRRRDSV
jgi:predicted aspartyl protease